MTSLTFCVGGPAGGGGAPGVAEPAAMLRSMCTTSLLWAPASPRLSDQPDAANRGWCLRARKKMPKLSQRNAQIGEAGP
jgi:hypothetical protein